jgi:recombinational DNA repair protein (RecF pathway)
MKCHRCGKSLGGSDRVLIAGGRTVCHECGRHKEPLVFTNAVRAMRAARKRSLVTGFPVTITLVPDEERRRTRYFLKVRRPEQIRGFAAQLSDT